MPWIDSGDVRPSIDSLPPILRIAFENLLRNRAIDHLHRIDGFRHPEVNRNARERIGIGGRKAFPVARAKLARSPEMKNQSNATMLFVFALN